MEYKFSKILDLAQRAFGEGTAKEMKPIKWLVDAQQLHRFMECVLKDHGIVEKEPAESLFRAMKKARKAVEKDFDVLKPKKAKKAKTKRKRK